MPLELKVLLDLPVVRVPTATGTRELVLDLYRPVTGDEACPLVIYIHGGGWCTGTQYRPPSKPRLFDEGFAVAAITYRFSGEAPFPACLHDCKLMVRWLRAHADRFGIDAKRMGAWGISAGGHLASLLGTTIGDPRWEGDGGWGDTSSGVSAVCNCCGPARLWHKAGDPMPPQDLVDLCAALVGGPLPENEDGARSASPLAHVSSETVPHLFIHGLADEIVPACHSEEMHVALQRTGVPSELILLPNTGHDLPPDALEEPVRRFFCEHFSG